MKTASFRAIGGALLVALIAALPAQAAGDAQMAEEFRRIAVRAEAMRGAKLDPPATAVRVPDDLRKVAAEIRARSVLDAGRLEARGRAWVDLGLSRSEEAPRRLLEILSADIRGVGQDPDGARLFIGPELLRPEDFEPSGEEDDPSAVLMMTGMRRDAPMIAHALMHLLQRQRDGRDFLDATTDRTLAAAAWAEGEANFVAMRYLFAGMRLDEASLALVDDPSQVLDGMLLPPPSEHASAVERGLLEFVYLDGYERVAAAHRGGGWGAVVSQSRLRLSSRDLMHPDREPLPSGAPSIEIDSPGKGWELVDEDSLGERATALLIAGITGKESSARRAADGWRHDRVLRWEKESGAGITRWVSEWMPTPDQPTPSAEKSAVDFAEAMGRVLRARFPDRELTPVGESAVTLLDGDRLFRVERRGSRVEVEIRSIGG